MSDEENEKKVECPVESCGYNTNMRVLDAAQKRLLLLESTRSHVSEDAWRDMDNFDRGEELARLRRAVHEVRRMNRTGSKRHESWKIATWLGEPLDDNMREALNHEAVRPMRELLAFIAMAFDNLDESLVREGPLPAPWVRQPHAVRDSVREPKDNEERILRAKSDLKAAFERMNAAFQSHLDAHGAYHTTYGEPPPFPCSKDDLKLAGIFAALAEIRLAEKVEETNVTHVGYSSREVPYVRERMHVAVKRYRELAKKYPDQADPDYVAWLAQKGRAEAWVERFDLGPVFTEKHRKHIKQQRWVPEDAYAVEFDARKLKTGHFAWHPKKGGSWADKKDAQRYALNAWEDNGQAPEHNCFWASHATNTSVPLYSVARVVKVGEVSHMGETLVEVAFDYGTPWMRNAVKRKALVEAAEKAGIRVLSRKEYERLLPKAVKFFKESEAKST